MAREISITVQTDDRITLEEVGQMFSRMAARAGEAVPAILSQVDVQAVDAGVVAAAVAEAMLTDTIHPTNEAVDLRVAAVAEAMLTDADVPAPPVTTTVIGDSVTVGDQYVVVEGRTLTLSEIPPLNAAIPAPGPTAWQPGQPITAGTVITSTGVPAPAPVGVELDKNGLPWDARINTSNRAKTQTGVWKMRKGLPDGEYDTVIAELRANMAAPGPVPAAPVAAEPVIVPPPPVEANIQHPNVFPGTPQPPVGALPNLDGPEDGFSAPPPGPAVAPPAAATVAPPPPVTPTPTAAMDFPNFITIVTQKQMEKKITLDEVIAVCNKHQLASPPALMSRPDLIPTVLAELEAIWATR